MKPDFILLDEAIDYHQNPNYPFSEEAYRIIGACMEVHKFLGKGFLEVVYKDALEFEFQDQGIPYQREMRLDIHYKTRVLPRRYFADFFVFEDIIVEVKAQYGIIDECYRQTINYLAACKKQFGLLINFGEDSLKYKRVILTK